MNHLRFFDGSGNLTESAPNTQAKHNLESSQQRAHQPAASADSRSADSARAAPLNSILEDSSDLP
jgi:hypothetical protein